MQISAKADYALRALIELGRHGDGPRRGVQLAEGQGLPPKFLEAILSGLRNHGILISRRGAEGGYWLARPADQITVAQIVRATDGSLASVRGQRPEDVTYEGAAAGLADVWIALRASLRSVLEAVSLADLVAGTLPASVAALLDEPDARRTR
ncbi:MAG: Rrf2 family transcriptional regulator [Actinomycetota bacterium]|nr:Rrf2 family transcriptional regulator [Actinomycetota bacterium]